MRLTHEQSEVKKKQAKKLYLKNLNYKQIAKKLEVTPKTISKWLKTTNEVKDLQKKLIQRINTALEDKTTPVKDIFCLFQSLNMCKSTSI